MEGYKLFVTKKKKKKNREWHHQHVWNKCTPLNPSGLNSTLGCQTRKGAPGLEWKAVKCGLMGSTHITTKEEEKAENRELSLSSSLRFPSDVSNVP